MIEAMIMADRHVQSEFLCILAAVMVLMRVLVQERHPLRRNSSIVTLTGREDHVVAEGDLGARSQNRPRFLAVAELMAASTEWEDRSEPEAAIDRADFLQIQRRELDGAGFLL
ncbi:unnamed protein product [Cuscuta epithymum]|uniref:Uncharacterized protein n=1 Tax=Cuscuta epithymum TaxID=186058 RepID=A0AAV0G0A8_9ASTE|nr:unnamed protein product [Cuscuta epithymum]